MQNNCQQTANDRSMNRSIYVCSLLLLCWKSHSLFLKQTVPTARNGQQTAHNRSTNGNRTVCSLFILFVECLKPFINSHFPFCSMTFFCNQIFNGTTSIGSNNFFQFRLEKNCSWLQPKRPKSL